MLTFAHRVLIALIIAIIGVFVMQIASPSNLSSFEMQPAAVQEAGQDLIAGESEKEDWFALFTMLSAAFLHANVGHITSNLLFLWVFGGLVGELLGWRWMLALFLATAIGGSLGDTILRNGETIPSLGASGTVLGFEGAYLGLAVRWSLPNPHIWPIAHPIAPMRLGLVAVVGFFLDISGVINAGTGIAYGAHLGGFLTGLFFTCFVTPRPRGV